MSAVTRPRRTISSAVLGEFMADLGTLRAQGWDGVSTLRSSPLSRNLREWWGDQVAERYHLDLYKLVEAGRADKTENPSPRRPQRSDALVNERRMRDALLDVVKPNSWTGRGVRELARLAGMNRETARHVLARMEADGQVERDRRQGKRGSRHGFRVLREHPSWSEYEKTHPLALSEPTSQVRVRKDPPLVTDKHGDLRSPVTASASRLEAASPRQGTWREKGQDQGRQRSSAVPAAGPSSRTGSGLRPTTRGGSFHPVTRENPFSLQVPAPPPEARPSPRAALGDVGPGASGSERPERERGLACPKPDWVAEAEAAEGQVRA
jgi:hypothetical protein